MKQTESVRTRLFVYGTLRRGYSRNYRLGEAAARFVGMGRIRGRLYDLGLYPGARRATKRTDRIIGELYELADSAGKLRELDRVEEFYPEKPSKSLFVRRRVEVELDDGTTQRAWAYFLNKKPLNAPLLAHGDYLQHKKDSRSARPRL
jgi:pyruvate carboxylase